MLTNLEAEHGGECDRLVPYLFWKCISNPWSHKKRYSAQHQEALSGQWELGLALLNEMGREGHAFSL